MTAARPFPRPAPATVLAGFMGAGKTTVGRLLAARRGAAFLDLDERIEARAGRPVAEIFREGGQERFRDLESAELASLALPPGAVLATGGGAWIRPANRAALLALGLPVLLTARPEILLARASREPRLRPLLPGGEDPHPRLAQLLEARMPGWEPIRLRVDTSDLSPEEVADRVERALLGA